MTCKVCGVDHDADLHKAVLSVRGWLAAQIAEFTQTVKWIADRDTSKTLGEASVQPRADGFGARIRTHYICDLKTDDGDDFRLTKFFGY